MYLSQKKSILIVLFCVIMPIGTSQPMRKRAASVGPTKRTSDAEFAQVLKNFSSLLNAIERNDLETVKALVPDEIRSPTNRVPERLLKTRQYGNATTPVEIAQSLGKQRIVDYFNESLNWVALDKAIKGDDLETVKGIVPEKIHPLQKTRGLGFTPLEIARHHKKNEIVEYLELFEPGAQEYEPAQLAEPTVPVKRKEKVATSITRTLPVQKSKILGVLSPAELSSELRELGATTGGAGVLPYAINESDNTLNFLFAKDDRGVYVGSWSDFGGGADPEDHNDPLTTASREAAEESMGLLGTPAQIRQLILDRGSILSAHQGSDGKYYIDYFIPFRYVPNVQTEFQSFASGNKKVYHQEKDRLAWMPYETLMQALETTGRLNKGEHAIIRHPDKKIGSIKFRGTTFGVYQQNLQNFRHLKSLVDQREFSTLPSATKQPTAAQRAPTAVKRLPTGVVSAVYRSQYVPKGEEADWTPEQMRLLDDLVRAIRRGDLKTVRQIVPGEIGIRARIAYPQQGYVRSPDLIAQDNKQQAIQDYFTPLLMQADADIELSTLRKLMSEGAREISYDDERDIRRFKYNDRYQRYQRGALHQQLIKQIEALENQITQKAQPELTPAPVPSVATPRTTPTKKVVAPAPTRVAAAPSAPLRLVQKTMPAVPAAVSSAQPPVKKMAMKTAASEETILRDRLNDLQKRGEDLSDQFATFMDQITALEQARYRAQRSPIRVAFENALKAFMRDDQPVPSAKVQLRSGAEETRLQKDIADAREAAAQFRRDFDALQKDITTWQTTYRQPSQLFQEAESVLKKLIE